MCRATGVRKKANQMAQITTALTTSTMTMSRARGLKRCHRPSQEVDRA
jgi:hypothetical protein